jgi:alpha-galactosidase
LASSVPFDSARAFGEHHVNEHFVLVTLALLIFSASLVAQDTVSAKLALTPPMGWNSWNKFACNVSEDMIREMADGMVKSGMKDAGYQYVVIDDC